MAIITLPAPPVLRAFKAETRPADEVHPYQLQLTYRAWNGGVPIDVPVVQLLEAAEVPVDFWATDLPLIVETQFALFGWDW